MKILLVEDDKIIWKNIKEYLEKSGFVVDWEENGQRWYIRALEYNYDLIILDVMLPDKDGFSIAKQIRQLNVETPIIFLTAKEDLQSKEKWFLSWWDDYITKPFSLKELLLRIRTILKRINNQKQLNILEIWDIVLNQDTKEVFRNWKKIELTPKEFALLEHLMLNDWKTISKDELLTSIWWYNNDIYSDVVRTHIKTLRDKLNKWFSKDPIKTIRWQGFMFKI